MNASRGSAFERDLHRRRKERSAHWKRLSPEEAADEANRDAGRALQWLAERRANAPGSHPARRARRALPT